MTVRDLIKKLQTLPQDYVVIMDNGSDYYPFGDDEDNISIVPASKKVMCHRPEANGYCRYHSEWWPKKMTPKFVDCVVLTV
jgi:hypothetical protein